MCGARVGLGRRATSDSILKHKCDLGVEGLCWVFSKNDNFAPPSSCEFEKPMETALLYQIVSVGRAIIYGKHIGFTSLDIHNLVGEVLILISG